MLKRLKDLLSHEQETDGEIKRMRYIDGDEDATVVQNAVTTEKLKRALT
jgi:hypothetical protein